MRRERFPVCSKYVLNGFSVSTGMHKVVAFNFVSLLLKRHTGEDDDKWVAFQSLKISSIIPQRNGNLLQIFIQVCAILFNVTLIRTDLNSCFL